MKVSSSSHTSRTKNTTRNPANHSSRGGGAGKNNSSSSGSKRYASTETRGPSEYKKEWSRFMSHVSRQRTEGARKTTAASPSTGGASAAANETTKLKRALDIQEDVMEGGSTFSYLFHSKSATAQVSKKKQEMAKMKQQEENQKRKEANVQKEKQRAKEIAAKKKAREERLALAKKESGKRRVRDEFDEASSEEEEQDDEKENKIKSGDVDDDNDDDDENSRQDDDDEDENDDEDDDALDEQERKSKMAKTLASAEEKGVKLDGLNRKQRRAALQLTRNKAIEKVEAQRKKITASDLMDQKLQWYQQGPYPLDEITEKLVNKKALKHAKTMPELKLDKYNYQLIHPSWLAARQRKRFEGMHALHEGVRTVFKDDEEN